MTTLLLLVDPAGWPTTLDPDVFSAVLGAQFRQPDPPPIMVRVLADGWAAALPAEECITFTLITRPLAPGWIDPLRVWVRHDHRLFTAYTDGADLADVRELTALTLPHAFHRPPFRIAPQTAFGLERAAVWMAESLYETAPILRPQAPPVRVAPTRWRNLPSNRADAHPYPDQFTAAASGAANYKLIAASTRGKTHAHHGTFREDAVALSATARWNILAVADGAGTAPMARVGSNLAVINAVSAIREAMPESPTTEDLGRALFAGLGAAHRAIHSFAAGENLPVSDLHTTFQLVVHWPQETTCLVGLVHVGDGIIAAEAVDGQFYLLTEGDTDPEDSGRTLFLTSAPVRQWMGRAKVYQFDERLNIVAMMTDGVAGDLEPYAERLQSGLFEALRSRVLCYPLREREGALLSMITYERRGSFDDRTLAILSRE